jgi:hypothetical protein
MKRIKPLFGILTTTAALVLQAHAQDWLTNGLVVYYPFNGDPSDASGHSNNGTASGATLTADRFGHANSAYYFNGGDILVPETIFGPTAEAVTVSSWITFDSGPYSDMGLVYEKSAVNGEMSIAIQTNYVFFGVKLASQRWVSAGAPLLTNSTMHVVGVYRRGQSISLYINGVLWASVPVPNEDLWTQGVNLVSALGSYHFNGIGWYFFRGAIDDFRVYTRALSASELQQLYLYEAGAPFITAHPRNQVGYWGKSVTFTVGAAGVPPLSYQWQKDTVPIAGGTGSSLVLTNLQVTDAGYYSVVVTNSLGSATSSNAYLTMNPAGVSLALYSGITIDGVVGLTYGIQYNTDLGNTNWWRGMANVTLSVPTELWFDVQPANQPQRYYRVVPGPISIP